MKNSTFTYQNSQPGLADANDTANSSDGTTNGSSKANEVANVVNQAVNVGSKIAGLFGGGSNESPSDKNKQAIQQELANMGYPQFSKMSGWGGDEAAKEMAMKIIYTAIKQYPEAGDVITNYLEGGKITPDTVTLVRQNFPPNISSEKQGSKGNQSQSTNTSNTAPENTGQNEFQANAATATKVNPLLVGGGLALGTLILIISLK